MCNEPEAVSLEQIEEVFMKQDAIAFAQVCLINSPRLQRAPRAVGAGVPAEVSAFRPPV